MNLKAGGMICLACGAALVNGVHQVECLPPSEKVQICPLAAIEHLHGHEREPTPPMRMKPITVAVSTSANDTGLMMTQNHVPFRVKL